MPTYSTPGVYIQELPATGPIAGVGTSVAAFVGPTAGRCGRINVPTMVTNWTQYKALFGEFSASPRLYVPHAVRGFFDNGGTIAWIVRVGTAATALLDLQDRAAGAAGVALRVMAKTEGADGNNIKVEVRDSPIVSAATNAKVVKARAAVSAASGVSVKFQNAADSNSFKAGDFVTIEGSTERSAVALVRAGELVLATPLTSAFDNTRFVRIADLAAGQTAFRVQNGAGLQPGSAVHLEQGANKGDYIVDNVAADFVTLAGGGLTAAYALDAASPDAAVTSYEFTLVFGRDGTVPETFANLAMDSRHPRCYVTAITSSLVRVLPPPVPSVQPPPNNMPKVAAATPLNGGINDDPTTIGQNNYGDALAALEKVDGINLVSAPDAAGSPNVLAAVIAHCEKMGDRFGLLDAGRTGSAADPGTTAVIALRAKVESQVGHAALYFPWIIINDPTSKGGNGSVAVPVSGHIAGICARSDNQRGVHKAPANELITGAIDLERILNDTDQGVLNDAGINALRIFPGQARPVVWGARTTAPIDLVDWRYVNVRRLFLFVEKSIQAGIRWAVFEPNDRSLWKKLDRTIGEFLTRVWRSGALFGQTAAEAFYVKIDDELNPEPVRALGQIFIEVGIAPVRPAEFVILRIALWSGGASDSASGSAS